MKAAVVPAVSSSWQIKDVPQPQPGSNQVLVKMHASGICYTDVHQTLGHFPGPFPRILGHEPVGEIVAVAPDVTTRKIRSEDACKRHLLHRCTPNARTLPRTIPPNPRSRAGRRDRGRGSRRHHAKDRRSCGYRLDSIHLRALRMVPAWPQNVLSLSEGYSG